MKMFYDDMSREDKLEMDSTRQDLDNVRRKIEVLRKEIDMDSESFKSYSDSIEKILGSRLSKKTTKVSIPLPKCDDNKKKVTEGIINESYKDIRDIIAETEAEFKKDDLDIVFSIVKIASKFLIMIFITMSLFWLTSLTITTTVSTQSEELPAISSTTTPSKGLPAPD